MDRSTCSYALMLSLQEEPRACKLQQWKLFKMYLKNYIAALYNINVQENISDFLKSFIKGYWRNCNSGEWCGPWASNANVTSMLMRLRLFWKIKKTNTISSVSKLFCILYLSFSSFEKWTTCKDVGFKLWYLPRVRYEIVLQKYRNPIRE